MKLFWKSSKISRILRLVGFFDIGMYEYDNVLIFMPINLLQKFLDNNERIDHYEIYC